MSDEDTINFDLIDDMKLCGYGESDASGAWIKLTILPEQLEKFRGLRGEIFEVALRLLDNEHKPVHKPKNEKRFGQNANILYKSGFFYNPKVVEQIGTDDEYQDWCRTQPCVICNQFGEIVQDGLKHAGEGRNIYAHTTRAGAKTSGKRGAGSNKPVFSGLPMCDKHHKLSHNPGPTSAYNEYCKIKGKDQTTNTAKAKHWFEEQSGRYLATWAHSKFAADFGYSSLAMVPPKKVLDWCQKNSLLYYLPSGFLLAIDE